MQTPPPNNRKGRNNGNTQPNQPQHNVVYVTKRMHPMFKTLAIAAIGFLTFENALLITDLWSNYFSGEKSDIALLTLGILAGPLAIIFLVGSDVMRD